MGKRLLSSLPLAPLPDLIHWWESQNARAVLIGGLAVALLGRPRVTRDVDGLILLSEDQWETFLAAGQVFGFTPRLTDAIEFAHESRVLLLRHQSSGIDVDVSLGCLPFEEEAVERAVITKVSGVGVPLPTPEDLVIMKAVAHRERDLLDIDGLLAAYPNLDVRRVRRWVKRFATALESPEIYQDIQSRLARLRPNRRGRGKN